jgi:NitT/TauT family transport system ATP-binding protein
VPLPPERTQDMKQLPAFRDLRAEILQRIRESTGLATDADMLDRLNLASH